MKIKMMIKKMKQWCLKIINSFFKKIDCLITHIRKKFSDGVIFHIQYFKEVGYEFYLFILADMKEDYEVFLEEEREGWRQTLEFGHDTRDWFILVWLFFKPVIVPIYVLITFSIRIARFLILVSFDNICIGLRGLSLYGRTVLSSVLITLSAATYTGGIMGGEPIYKKRYGKWHHGEMFMPGGKLYYPKIKKPFHEMEDPFTRGGLRMVLEFIEQNTEFAYLLNKFYKRRGYDKETGERRVEILKQEMEYGDNLGDWRQSTLHKMIVELQNQVDAAEHFAEKSQRMQEKVEKFLDCGSEYVKYIHFGYDKTPLVNFQRTHEAAIKILTTIKERGVEALPRSLQEQMGSYIWQIGRMDHGAEALAKNQTLRRGNGYYCGPWHRTWRLTSKEALDENSTAGVQGLNNKPFIFPYPNMVQNNNLKSLNLVIKPNLNFDWELSHRWGTRRCSLVDPMSWSHPPGIEGQTHFTPRFSYELFPHLNKAKLYHRKYPAPHARHYTSVKEDIIGADEMDWILSFFYYIPDSYFIGIFSICSLVLTMALFLISIVGVPQIAMMRRFHHMNAASTIGRYTTKVDVKYYLVVFYLLFLILNCFVYAVIVGY